MKDLIPYLVPFMALAGGWFLGRRRRYAESRLTEARAENTELEGVEKAIKIWRTLAQELQQEVDKLRDVVNELKIENEKLRTEVEDLRNQLNKGQGYVD